MTVFQTLRDTLKDLPVHGIIADVVKDVQSGAVTVVAARTGSGKSMMLPSALADAGSVQVVVLVPRRFLATDAACNVAELAGVTLGQEVGFALGQVNDEKSLHVPDTKLLFCTYGYALRSGLINRASTIVLDEVHEGDEHISLARAVLHERKQREPDLQILEMSATVNAKRQASFWSDIATTTIHEAQGSEHACDLIHESPMRAGNKDRTIEQVVLGLLEGEGREAVRPAVAAPAAKDTSLNEFASMLAESEHGHAHGSKGIAVFRGGVKEVENTVTELKKLLAAEGITKVEVVGIHSGTPSDERRDARRPPKEGWRKIIVGTNVIESGVNLRWVDAGVSDGVRKVPHHREDTGADALVPEDLPQAGITQQMGRINRDPAATGFQRGIYILHAKNNFEQRLKQNGPAIDRESMLAPAFHAASLGYDPTQLKWDMSPEHKAAFPDRLARARADLQRLELIHSDWSLTSDGAFINRLPVSPETGAMLNEAHLLDMARVRDKQPARVLRDMILIAAIGESRNLKLYSKKSHGADRERTSDLIDAMNAFRNVRARATEAGIVPSVVIASNENELATATKEELHTLAMQRAALDAICADDNMSVNGYIQVAQLVAEIAKRLGDKLGIAIAESDTPETYDAPRYDELKRAILNGHVNQLYQLEHGELRDLIRDTGNRKRDNGLPFSGYEIAESSIVQGNKKIGLEGTLVAGYLRELQPKRAQGKPDDERPRASKKTPMDARNEPMLVLSDVSIIPAAVFVAWAKDRAERYAPVVTAAHLSPDGKLHANYVGHARFELPLAGDALREAGFLVDVVKA